MIEKLRKIQLFSSGSEALLSAINSCAWEISLGEGEPVIWEGDLSEAVYFITAGAVEIYRNAVDGREHTLGVIRTGGMFGMVPILTESGENIANARCIQPTQLILVRKADFENILNRFSDFSQKVLQEVATRLAAMTRKAGELALLSVKQRLAAFLIKEADSKKRGDQIFWTRDDMARQIGTVRDVVTRYLRIFEEEGLIRRERGNILLLDKEGLENFVYGSDTT